MKQNEFYPFALKALLGKKIYRGRWPEAAFGAGNAAIGGYIDHLAYFRKFYPVETICMHGSPMSRYDNRLIWQKYDYRELGIIGEPYFDIDFDRVFYLTDTGRPQLNSRKIQVH